MVKSSRFRLAISLLLIMVWFGIAGFGGPTFGKISGVATNDQAAFLPASAESTKVQNLQSKYQAGKSIPATVILEYKNDITRTDIVAAAPLAKKLTSIDGVESQVIGPIPSKDKRALQFIALIKDGSEIRTVVASIRENLKENTPKNVVAYVTGPAGLSADLANAFGGIDGILLLVALSAVLIILLSVYRAMLLPLLVLLNAMFALCASILVVYVLAKVGIIKLNGQSQGILSILVIGAATDYSLLLVSRYRERLAVERDKYTALLTGLRNSIEPIAASAATVALALLCLLFSDLNSNRSLGPIAAIGIVFAFVSSITFLPALLAVFGRVAFWPTRLKPHSEERTTVRTGLEELGGPWKRIAPILQTHYRMIWIGTIAGLLLCCLGLLQLKANGVPQTELILGPAQSIQGQKVLAQHFDAGSSAPTLISVPKDQVDQTLRVVRSIPEFTLIRAYSERGPSTQLAAAKVIDNSILLSVSSNVDPYSDVASKTVTQLRNHLNQANLSALVGGTTALALDTTTTAENDIRKIIPIVLVVIFFVLALLLRALIAPLLLIATVVLSFGATIGISAVLFNTAFDFPGADASVPLFGFVFLVALGVDYNIFLITRTREEAQRYGTRAAILHSLGKTGTVITSAGIVLAATFAALGIIPILFLAQIAFIVGFGVLLDTFIVRSLLVPALFYEVGAKVWWPSKLQK